MYIYPTDTGEKKHEFCEQFSLFPFLKYLLDALLCARHCSEIFGYSQKIGTVIALTRFMF